MASLVLGAGLSCSSPSTTELKSGIWRGTLSRDDQRLPILLDISKSADGKSYQVYSINGNERLALDSAYFQNDSLHIPMQIFNSEIVAKLNGDVLQGTYNRLKGNTVESSLPFEAKFGENYRFFKAGEAKSAHNIAGKWRTVFKNTATGDTTQAVGTFEQKGTDVSGSFLTPTGDYRFLSGSVHGDSLFLSTFDGSNALLFKAAISSDGALSGALWSGIKGYRTWNAQRDESASLPDANALTYLKPGFETLQFSFPDVNGNQVAFPGSAYKNKVVVVQILGSWCPNCMDETNFLEPWYKKNKERGVEIIGLAFEHSDQLEVSAPKLKKMISRFDMTYPVLLAGTNTNEATAKALPMLNKVMSYPTTIILDKKGKVRQIHTGFSGPGTGVYYDQYVEDFNALLDKLIAE